MTKSVDMPKSQGVDRLFTAFGGAAQQAVRNFGEGAQHYCNIENGAAVDKALGPETTVLVKAHAL